MTSDFSYKGQQAFAKKNDNTSNKNEGIPQLNY